MKTLGVRVERQNESAMKLATRLEKHPRIARVHYPGLASHQDHKTAVSQACCDAFIGVALCVRLLFLTQQQPYRCWGLVVWFPLR